VLSRASADEARGTLSSRAADLARLACRRAARDFRRALDEEERPDDELVERLTRAP